jgi:Asp/Glu/hydantoin racemase
MLLKHKSGCLGEVIGRLGGGLQLLEQGQRLVTLGAELIVCHGMSMSPIEYPAQEYAAAIDVPVLEGLGCGIAMAEAWVRIGARYSLIRHPHEERG